MKNTKKITTTNERTFKQIPSEHDWKELIENTPRKVDFSQCKELGDECQKEIIEIILKNKEIDLNIENTQITQDLHVKIIDTLNKVEERKWTLQVTVEGIPYVLTHENPIYRPREVHSVMGYGFNKKDIVEKIHNFSCKDKTTDNKDKEEKQKPVVDKRKESSSRVEDKDNNYNSFSSRSSFSSGFSTDNEGKILIRRVKNTVDALKNAFCENHKGVLKATITIALTKENNGVIVTYGTAKSNKNEANISSEEINNMLKNINAFDTLKSELSKTNHK